MIEMYPLGFLALFCIDGWLTKIIAAMDRRTDALQNAQPHGSDGQGPVSNWATPGTQNDCI